jgi:4,5-DOPA dioxygenase extradiol
MAETDSMPVLFAGHGSPMNAIEDNAFSRGWQEVAKKLPRPKAILCISAHWETAGTMVTAMPKPRTIHDFGGFPSELYDVQYPAPGSQWLASEVQKIVSGYPVGLDSSWGLDHGCWSVLRRMYPQADIPVVQLSLDYTAPARDHYNLAKELLGLRRQGVLIVGSGNIVHNLGLARLRGNDFNAPFAFDWALEASALFKKLIDSGDHQALIDYQSLGRAVALAVPTPEHYLTLLYVLALKQDGETITYFNDQPVAGSLTMTSLIIGG